MSVASIVASIVVYLQTAYSWIATYAPVLSDIFSAINTMVSGIMSGIQAIIDALSDDEQTALFNGKTREEYLAATEATVRAKVEEKFKAVEGTAVTEETAEEIEAWVTEWLLKDHGFAADDGGADVMKNPGDNL